MSNKDTGMGHCEGNGTVRSYYTNLTNKFVGCGEEISKSLAAGLGMYGTLWCMAMGFGKGRLSKLMGSWAEHLVCVVFITRYELPLKWARGRGEVP